MNLILIFLSLWSLLELISWFITDEKTEMPSHAARIVHLERLIYEIPSVFIAIIKFTPVRLSEVMKTCPIKHFTIIVMTNLMYLWNVFIEKAVQKEK